MMEPLSLHYNTRMGKENPVSQVPKIGGLGGLRLIFSNKSRIALSQSRHPCVCFMEKETKKPLPQWLQHIPTNCLTFQGLLSFAMNHNMCFT